MVLYASGDARARASAREGIRKAETVLAKDRDWSVLVCKALMHAIVGERQAALASHREAIEVNRSKGNSLFVSFVERDRLRLHALLGDRKEALAQLADQLKLPGWSAHDMRVDPALASLWNDPGFLRIVNDPASNAPVSFDVRYAAAAK